MDEKIKVGDMAHGGIVFYFDDTGEHGLVCQTENLKGDYSWDEAMKAANDIGDSWRLPTKDELNLMYENLHKKGFGGFGSYYYWSSTEYVSNLVWNQNFSNGNQYFNGKSNTTHVRAVRAF